MCTLVLVFKIVFLFMALIYTVGWIDELVIYKRSRGITTLLMIFGIIGFVALQWLI